MAAPIAILIIAGGAGAAFYALEKERAAKEQRQREFDAMQAAQMQPDGPEWWEAWGQGQGGGSSAPAWLPIAQWGIGQVMNSNNRQGGGGWLSGLFGRNRGAQAPQGGNQGKTPVTGGGQISGPAVNKGQARAPLAPGGPGDWLSGLFGGNQGKTPVTGGGQISGPAVNKGQARAPVARQPLPPRQPGVRGPEQSGGVNAMLDLIGQAEAPRGYNQVWGGTRLDPPRPITSMTVAEVLDWQRASVRAGSFSSASGKYQIIRPTLQSLVDDGSVRPDEQFNRATQDRLGVSLMNRRGLRDFQSGRINETTFAQRLSQEWAGLPAATRDRAGRPATGQSYYADDGVNNATVSLQSVLAAIRGL